MLHCEPKLYHQLLYYRHRFCAAAARCRCSQCGRRSSGYCPRPANDPVNVVIENGALAAHVKLLVFIHGNAGRAGGLDIHLGQLFAAEQNLRLVVAGVGDDLRRSASAAVEKKKSQEKALCIRIFVALPPRPPNLHFLNHHRSRPGLNEALR